MEEIGGEDKGDMLVTDGVGERLQPHVERGTQSWYRGKKGREVGEIPVPGPGTFIQ